MAFILPWELRAVASRDRNLWNNEGRERKDERRKKERGKKKERDGKK